LVVGEVAVEVLPASVVVASVTVDVLICWTLFVVDTILVVVVISAGTLIGVFVVKVLGNEALSVTLVVLVTDTPVVAAAVVCTEAAGVDVTVVVVRCGVVSDVDPIVGDVLVN
jgi:hypothetical protein